MTHVIHCLNGPNLNLLGTREPAVYGTTTLAQIEAALKEQSAHLGLEMMFRQTNHEGELVEWVQDASREASGLILNAAAYTHTSIALHDALKACKCRVIEVHLSNPAARDAFRQTNYVSPVVSGSIAGLGAQGYDLALTALAQNIISE